MDFNFILLFIDSAFLQLPDFLGGERMALGSDDPIIKGLIVSMFAVSFFFLPNILHELKIKDAHNSMIIRVLNMFVSAFVLVKY